MSPFQEKLRNQIEVNRPKASAMIERMVQDSQNIENIILPAQNLRLSDYNGDPVFMHFDQEFKHTEHFPTKLGTFPFHQVHHNAASQLATKLGLPSAFTRKMLFGDNWQREEMTNMINAFLERSENKVMVRVLNGRAKAVLSDRYKPMNNGYVFARAIQGARSVGAELYNSYNGDLHGWMELISPEVYQVKTPRNGSISLAFGASVKSSDYGLGSLQVSGFTLQLVCLNGMTSKRTISMKHLGKRLDDNVVYQEQTVRKELDATASIIQDNVRHLLHPDAISKQIEQINRASMDKLEVDQSEELLRSTPLSDEEVDFVKNILYGDSVHYGVTGELTRFKLSQAITATHHMIQDQERNREIMEIGGAMIGI